MKIKKHIPNILSSIRLFSPLVLVPLLVSGNYGGGFIALCGFLGTDAIDGYLARKWKVQSDLGAKIDAFADKIILASLLIPLIIQYPFILFNLVLEGGISLINISRSLNGGKPKTLQIGRLKMIIISLFMAISYLSNVVTIPSVILPIMFVLTSCFQVKALSRYNNELIKELSRKNNKNEKSDCKEKIIEKENNNLVELENEKQINALNNELINNKEELIKLRQELLNSDNNLEESKQKVKRK